MLMSLMETAKSEPINFKSRDRSTQLEAGWREVAAKH